MVNFQEYSEKLISKADSHGLMASLLMKNSSELNISVDKNELETVTHDESSSIYLSLIKDAKRFVFSFNQLDIDDIDRMIKYFTDIIEFLPDDPYFDLAQKKLKDNKLITSWAGNKLTGENSDWLVDYVKNLYSYTSSYSDKIKMIESCRGSHSYMNTSFVNSHGIMGNYESEAYSSYVVAIASNDHNSSIGMENYYDQTMGCTKDSLMSAKLLGELVAAGAIKKLGSQSIKTGEMPVIFMPRVASSLMSDFISAINGASIAKKSSFLADKLDSKIFKDDVCIIDDPLLKNGVLSKKFDDEGVECNTLPLVTNGVLKSYLLDLKSAKMLQMKSTANASINGGAINPSTTNLYIKPTTISRDSMVADIKYGVIIDGLMGHGANIINGDYSQGATGFLIENGKITSPLSEIAVAGNLLDLFKTMQVADDLSFQYAYNAPSIMMPKMTVSGSKK
ncbi:MAG: TldD/PmbA family protein [Anaplasmataceae bacterium]|nr:TldD/PmbA family protein [Anaplasmataceae bacterium]